MEKENYEDLFFTDDFMFCKIMTSNESICRRVIEVLLGIEVEKLTYLNSQQELRPGYFSHGIRMDVVAKGSGEVFDLEIQTSNPKNLPERARYYQAAMDIDSLKKGSDYESLPYSYIVFICLDDPFGGGLPRYTVAPHCKENAEFDKKVNDKTLKVYYNARDWEKLAEDDAEVKAFLRFLKTKQPEDELTEDIMTEVETAWHNEPWRVEFLHMHELIERGRKEAQKELAAAQAQLAADQVRIAELEARIAQLEAAAN